MRNDVNDFMLAYNLICYGVKELEGPSHEQALRSFKKDGRGKADEDGKGRLTRA